MCLLIHDTANFTLTYQIPLSYTPATKKEILVKMLKAIRNHYFRDMLNRMNDLETAVRVMLTSPNYLPCVAAGLNGSVNRKRIFAELQRLYDFRCILETGTYLGDSAGYFAQTAGIPVHSSEINPLLYAVARSRLQAGRFSRSRSRSACPSPRDMRRGR